MVAFLITFRETLEAALVVGIVLAFLNRTGNREYRKIVYWGILSGILLSTIFAFGFQWFLGGFSGKVEKVSEGFFSLAGAALITTLILWMARHRNVILSIESKVAASIKKANPMGVYLLILVSILREGIETVVFLESAGTMGNVGFLSSVLGIAAALSLGYLIFFTSMRISLRAVFNVTNILLILFAAGLVAYGIHELQEAGMIPTIVEHVWDINGFIDENGYLGSVLKGTFGYNGNPSFIEVVAYWIYLLVALGMSIKGSSIKSQTKEVTVK